MDLITSLTSQVVNKALDGLSLRGKAIAGNLANVDTPGYHRRDVGFEGQLQSALQNMRNQGKGAGRQLASNDEDLTLTATRPEHIANGNTALTVNDVALNITADESAAARNDGNGVDVESEMSQLARNTQRYLALTNLEGRRMRSMRDVIGSGG